MSIFEKIFKVDKKAPVVVSKNVAPVVQIEQQQPTKQFRPQDFPEAVLLIVSERGNGVINDRVFINILDDYQVLKSVPALKNTLLLMQDKKVFNKLINCTNWELESVDLCNQFVSNYGIKQALAKYIIECIGFGIGKVICKPAITSEPETEVHIQSNVSTHSIPTAAYYKETVISFNPRNELPNYNLPIIDKIIPFQSPGTKCINDIINSSEFRDTKCKLPVALGFDDNGEPAVYDLVQMPHLLIAGSTCKGKSVAIHNILLSLLCKKHPVEVKLTLLDTKGVEYWGYRNIVNHFLAVRNDVYSTDIDIPSKTEDIIAHLKALCIEMEMRKDLLRNACARSLESYNSMFCSRQLNPSLGNRFLPYIVVVIDDFGNLMIDNTKEAEQIVTKLAQKGHLVGIHLIISTQITTKEILTPAIRTQFPTRMAFGLLSAYDSKLIIRTGDACNITEPGDFYFMAGGNKIMLHAPYVNDVQLDVIIKEVASQKAFSNPYYLTEQAIENSLATVEFDPLLKESAKLVVLYQMASSSFLQRKLGIGFNRCNRIIDQLETTGIIGPAYGVKPRQILCHSNIELDTLLKKLKI